MRIIGGSARGRRIAAPPGQGTRPTRDRVRQTLFDVLGQRCDGLLVVDLYAGSGALGLEALSRGAERCTFVERDKGALAVLRQNIATLGFEARSHVVAGDAPSYVPEAPADLVLADPPYEVGPGPALTALGAAPARLVPGARVVVEHDRRVAAPKTVGELARYDQRRFGDTVLSFYRREARPA